MFYSCQACKVMSGFDKLEAHFSGRFYIKLLYKIEEYENFLLPKISQWRDEQDTEISGDNTICCYKFLYQLLPYLVEVLVTDGIFFIPDYPNHIMSRYLVEKFQDIGHGQYRQGEKCQK